MRLFSVLHICLVSGLAHLASTAPSIDVDDHHGRNLLVERNAAETHVLHERIPPHAAASWHRGARVPSRTVLPMRIGLKQSNLEAGHERLMAISDPMSEEYGKHMTAEQVIEFFKPSDQTVNSVMGWLVSSGIPSTSLSLSTNKQWIQFDAKVEDVERVLFTTFYTWHTDNGSKDIACDGYHVPGEIQEHVDYLLPGVRLRASSQQGNQPSHAKRDGYGDKYKLKDHQRQGVKPPTLRRIENKLAKGIKPDCSEQVNADCVRAQYGIPKGSKAAKNNSLGIFASLNQYYGQADLDLFLKTYAPEIPQGSRPKANSINGALTSIEDVRKFYQIEYYPVGTEANLDLQASIPLIWPQTTEIFQTDDWYWETASQGFLNTFLDAIDGSYCSYSAFNTTGDCHSDECQDPEYPNADDLYGFKGPRQCGVYKPTNVISISYGGIEDFLPNNYQYRQCKEYMKLGLQGVTVVASSGDSGVGSPGFKCIDGFIFVPSFPAACPYVLTVGSTELRKPQGEGNGTKLEEVATTRFASGGGFSNIHGVAGYQRKAVQEYYDQVESTLPFKGYHQIIVNGTFPQSIVKANQTFHHGGRGYPDVAAIGDSHVIIIDGVSYLIGGTSLSAPIWASLLTLINEERIASGKRSIGFVNPTLYANPQAFNDITVGSNPGCKDPTFTRNVGFPTAKGWDPVTGLGSPKYDELARILVSAP